MRYYGISKTLYELDAKPFGQGGEGDIYYDRGDGSIVAKIYHPDRLSEELEQKLRYMVDNPPVESILTQVAWPLDILYDSSNQFQGFVMPKLDITTELSDIYVYPPMIGYNNKLIIAMNICSVINAVHEAGYVFGDFNPRNIGINTDTGMVAFLDTDSYHIVLDKEANQAYRCKVCFDGYVAPELIKHCEPYKKDAYATAPLPTFTQETDRFALAVHIFRLLMNGFHPFNGFKETDTLSTPVPRGNNQAIKQDNYCFKPGNKPMAAAVPDLSVLPEEIADLFTDAFINGRTHPEKRPTARQWYTALLNYEKELHQCKDNPLHFYKNSLRNCPWCEADKKYNEAVNQASIYQQRRFASPQKIVKPPNAYQTNPSRPTIQPPRALSGGAQGNYKNNIIEIKELLLGALAGLVFGFLSLLPAAFVDSTASTVIGSGFISISYLLAATIFGGYMGSRGKRAILKFLFAGLAVLILIIVSISKGSETDNEGQINNEKGETNYTKEADTITESLFDKSNWKFSDFENNYDCPYYLKNVEQTSVWRDYEFDGIGEEYYSELDVKYDSEDKPKTDSGVSEMIWQYMYFEGELTPDDSNILSGKCRENRDYYLDKSEEFFFALCSSIEEATGEKGEKNTSDFGGDPDETFTVKWENATIDMRKGDITLIRYADKEAITIIYIMLEYQ